MIPRALSTGLKLFVILFPVGAGLYLTSFGVVKLSEVSIIPSKKTISPYGFLVFSSVPLKKVDTHIYSSFSLKEDVMNCGIVFFLEFDDYLDGEQVIGFQFPCKVELDEPRISVGLKLEGNDGQRRIPIEIKEAESNLVDESEWTSIVYARFIASQGVIHYEGNVNCKLRGLTFREDFSTYSISLPIAGSRLTIHNAVNNYCPEANSYIGCDLNLVIGLYLPEGCDLKRVQPLPDGEQLMPGEGGRRIVWFDPSKSALGFETGFPHPVSECITVTIEVRSKLELKNRLLFDSGLYMGLGVSLLFGGILEALKVAVELRRKPSA